MVEFLFSPHSMYWRVNREWLIALAGPRAVMLELAHPSVAAGVAQHSAYDTDPFGRLYRTMKTMTDISFGDADEARDALRAFHACHARVHGKTAEGVPYRARDPQLQVWVWATLVDSVLRVYERFVSPLAFAEKCAYYADAARLAQWLGIPQEFVPPTFTAFNLYMGVMLYGDTLQITDDARKVVDALYAQTLRGRATRWFSFASIGILPPRLRYEYGYTWSDADEKNLERIAAWSCRLRAHVPPLFAIHPKARQSEHAWRTAQWKHQPIMKPDGHAAKR